VNWTPETIGRFRATIDHYTQGCVAEGFRYPLVCTLVSSSGCVIVLRYVEGEPTPAGLLEHGAEWQFPAWMTIQDQHGKAGCFTFFDPEPVEALKEKLFPY